MAVWFYVNQGDAPAKTRREDVALVRLATTSHILVARLAMLAEAVQGIRLAEGRIEIGEASLWCIEGVNDAPMQSTLVIDQSGHCWIKGQNTHTGELLQSVSVPVNAVIAFSSRDCDHYALGRSGVPAALFAAAVQAAKRQEAGEIEVGTPLTVVNTEIRDCGYGFSGCALMSDGSRAFHTGHLCATAEQAGREVTAKVNAAGVPQARLYA